MAMLTDAKVRKLKHTGKHKREDSHGDLYGLMLRIQPTGGKSWVQRVTVRGKRISMGLGGYPVVTLKEARETALENRRMARQGIDPSNNARKARTTAPTFRVLAEAVIKAHEPTWRGGADSPTAKQWRASLATYAHPVIGSMAVDAIDSADVLRVLEPIWVEKHPTANNVRQRISAVMKTAIAKGHRLDDPAGDAIIKGLPNARHCGEHHAAVHYSLVGDAVRKVRASRRTKPVKLVFEFQVLTAARPGEAAGATWDEVDLEAATWTVPAERMKAGKEHRVPLSPRCVAILREAQATRVKSPFVFPSRGKPMAKSTLGKVLKGLGIKATDGQIAKPHGFRSSFRDWVAEQTDAPGEVAELALAHAVGNAVVAAYARSDLFEKRRALMEKWAAYLAQEKNPA